VRGPVVGIPASYYPESVTRRALRTLVSLLLMAALTALFLWNVDLGKVGSALGQARPLWLALAVTLALGSYWFRAVRWQLILRPVGKVRHSSALLANAVGYAAMTLLPARMGDLVRPVVLARREHLPMSAALASILTERVFDLFSVVFFFLIFIVWPPAMPALGEQARSHLEILRLSGYAAGAVLVVGVVLVLGLLRYQERFVELATRPVARVRPRWRPPLQRFLGHFLNGLRVLQRPRDLVVTTGASLLLWYGIAWQVRFTLMAFHLDLDLRVSYFLLTMAVLGLAIPTPGGVGGFHKATQVGLTAFFAVGLNRATAVAIAYHAICFLPITIIGLLCLPLVDLRLREVGVLSTSGPPATHTREAAEP
jgi:glycosyltransferase 2 family protein